MQNPAISVVMPVRNGNKFLDQAVASILHQSDPDLELLIIDDHSTDATPDLIAGWVAADHRVRGLKARERGIVGARNTGLAHARADLIATMDSDDVALPDRLRKQRAYLERNADIVALGSCAQWIDDEGRPLDPIVVPTEDADIRRSLTRYCALIHSTTMIRRKQFLALGGYRNCFSVSQDYDLWLRIAEIGKLENLPENLLQLRHHGDQVSRKRRLQQRGAAALARRMAQSRRTLGTEPVSTDLTLQKAIMGCLRSLGPRDVADQCARRDFELMVRTLGKDRILRLADLLQFRPIFAKIGARRSLPILLKLAIGR